IGLIRYRGPGVAKEYFHTDNRERELGAFFRDGWFYPGDVGSLNTDGYLFLHGRERDMIIRAGVNIFPSEIELILSQHPDVIDVSVTGRIAHLHGEKVVAFIVPRNAEVNKEDLIDYSRGQLAPYKVPERIYFIDRIPRNRGGKVIKSELIGN
ncbi:MAG: fatty acid--CoA ligase family protein, partial [Candidatus Poribacteria bacterium]|nr:fatty acid--CoA ligase family protein [Candidatus Poribacteria bacterium]